MHLYASACILINLFMLLHQYSTSILVICTLDYPALVSITGRMIEAFSLKAYKNKENDS